MQRRHFYAGGRRSAAQLLGEEVFGPIHACYSGGHPDKVIDAITPPVMA
jgi:hypothetical protein